MLKASQNLLVIQKLKSLLSSEFETNDTEKIIGMEIKRDRSRRKSFCVRRNTVRKC